MEIGLYIQWDLGSLRSSGNVLGDELIGQAMCRSLRSFDDVERAELYAPNHPPAGPLDVMVYLNDTPPRPEWARRHVAYMQNGYGQGSEQVLRGLQERDYDGYAFISKRILARHRATGHEGIFLPFGVDTEAFAPRPWDPEYAFEVAYVGNDIKGRERTERYILPAIDFRFGLYGTWPQRPGQRNWLRRLGLRRPKPDTRLAYQRTLGALSRGKIAQEKVPVLYSSAAVNLNCTIQDCVDWDVITLRTFEVLACRGFLITDRVPAAEEALAGCAVFTDGGDDLREKIRYYLDHEAERRAIAEAGYAYVTRHATLESRMTELRTYLQGLL